MTIIYKFQHNQDIYIGSTNKTLKQRAMEHRDCLHRQGRIHTDFYKYCLENELEQLSNKEIFFNCFSVLEETNTELDFYGRTFIEQRYMDEYEPNLNMRKAFITRN